MKPIPLLFIPAFALLLTNAPGCGSRPVAAVPVAVIDNNSSTRLAEVAGDTVEQISQVYPSVQTRFVFDSPPVDPFGAALVRDLRLRGYAINEGGGDPGGIALQFETATVDGQYYLAVHLDGKTLSRIYSDATGPFEPVSLWAMRE